MAKPAALAGLYDWYRANHRPLPWRGTRDPWRIWVSEVMLQQTRVETVLPYYEGFLARFPDVRSFAAASLQEALLVWEGLGYYARCRNLHRAARIVVAAPHHGAIPTTAEALRRLPGLGRSSAGAVASIAFGEAAPVLDGNVKRVLARLYDVRGAITHPKTLDRLWQIATRLVQFAPDPGMHNQALMELGAMHCTPDAPNCEQCPLNSRCKSRRRGTTDRVPRRAPPRVRPHLDIAVGVIVRDSGSVFIQRRPDHKMLGGLWEFPGGKVEPGETPEQALHRELREELDVEVTGVRVFTTVRHEYTHLKVTLHVFLCELGLEEPKPLAAKESCWTPIRALRTFPFPRANRKVIEVLEKRFQQL